MIMQKMLRQNQSMEEISQFTELPVDLTKEIADQIYTHPEWSDEQILEMIRKPKNTA